MKIVLFALAWIILGIIGLVMATRVAEKTIETVHNIDKCTDNDLMAAVFIEDEKTSQMGADPFLINILKHPIITDVVAIIFWPIIIPLVIYGWNHYGEL